MKTAGSAALSQSVAVSVTDQVDNLASSPTFPIVQDTMAPTFPDPGHRPLRVSNTGAWVQAGPVMVSPVTKYYTHGGSRVAMRQGDEV